MKKEQTKTTNIDLSHEQQREMRIISERNELKTIRLLKRGIKEKREVFTPIWKVYSFLRFPQLCQQFLEIFFSAIIFLHAHISANLLVLNDCLEYLVNIWKERKKENLRDHLSQHIVRLHLLLKEKLRQRKKKSPKHNLSVSWEITKTSQISYYISLRAFKISHPTNCKITRKPEFFSNHNKQLSNTLASPCPFLVCIFYSV